MTSLVILRERNLGPIITTPKTHFPNVHISENKDKFKVELLLIRPENEPLTQLSQFKRVSNQIS